MKKIGALVLILTTMFFLIGGCSGAKKTEEGQVDRKAIINIENFAFAPPALVIKKGVKVIWVNQDNVAHTVTSPGNFDSGTIESEASWSRTFNEQGTFEYNCTIHPSMVGEITVE